MGRWALENVLDTCWRIPDIGTSVRTSAQRLDTDLAAAKSCKVTERPGGEALKLQASPLEVACGAVSIIASCERTAIYERSGALDLSSKSFQWRVLFDGRSAAMAEAAAEFPCRRCGALWGFHGTLCTMSVRRCALMSLRVRAESAAVQRASSKVVRIIGGSSAEVESLEQAGEAQGGYGGKTLPCWQYGGRVSAESDRVGR